MTKNHRRRRLPVAGRRLKDATGTLIQQVAELFSSRPVADFHMTSREPVPRPIQYSTVPADRRMGNLPAATSAAGTEYAPLLGLDCVMVPASDRGVEQDKRGYLGRAPRRDGSSWSPRLCRADGGAVPPGTWNTRSDWRSRLPRPVPDAFGRHPADRRCDDASRGGGARGHDAPGCHVFRRLFPRSQDAGPWPSAHTAGWAHEITRVRRRACWRNHGFPASSRGFSSSRRGTWRAGFRHRR